MRDRLLPARVTALARPRHRLRRLRRLGHRAVDQPAPPDVAARRAATACCSSSRSGLRRPQLAGRDLRADRAPPAARASRRRARRDGVHVLSPLVLPLHSQRRGAARSTRGCCRALVRRAARRARAWTRPDPVGLRAAGRGAARRARPVARRLPLRRRHRRAGGHRRAPRSAPPRRASRAAPTSCSPARRRSPSGMRTLNEQRARRAERRRHRAASRTALERRARSTPALDALPAPAHRLHRRGRRDEARPRRCSSRLARAAAGLVDRARRAGRPRATRAPTSRRSSAEPNVHLLGARRYDELPAVLRGADAGADPLRAQRADRRRSSR